MATKKPDGQRDSGPDSGPDGGPDDGPDDERYGQDRDAGLLARIRKGSKSKNYKQLALDTLVELLNSDDDKIRLQAAQTLLAYDSPGTPADRIISAVKKKLPG